MRPSILDPRSSILYPLSSILDPQILNPRLRSYSARRGVFQPSHRYANLDLVHAYVRFVMIARLKLPSSFANYQSYRRQLAVLASLGFATALCLGLLALRAWHYGASARPWLVWNLFLAWLPALGALAAYNLNHWPTRFRLLSIIGFSILWLLFLLNALFLINDIIHLKQQSGVPLWYGLITLVDSSWTASVLGSV